MSVEQQTKTLADFLPGGRLFVQKGRADSNFYKFLRGLAAEFFEANTLIEQFLFDIFPNQTELLIDEWEQAVGIPDDCFPGTGTLAERRQHVLAKLASLGVTTADDFVALANILGVTVTITNSIDELSASQFTMTFPFELDESPVVPTTFTMVFPFTLGGDTIADEKRFEIIVYHVGPQPLIRCLFAKLKPAHCTITFIEQPVGIQGCGDPLMQCGEPFALCGD